VVRSLVRASLDVESSPSAVLERVNRLVVPDAAHGMFITLAYAVLDLNAGTLEYANAGHNPPLVVRKDGCTIESFERGGMALGVLEDNRIRGGSTYLESGDYLVMYTDGVTEAFSPDGDIFGEERLYSTITAEISCHNADPDLAHDAQHLVDAIDRQVTEFIGQASRTDDLTLLVLKRL
jgi:serine phosphatase RsbU (regulator of sigma subunit)